MQFSIILPVLNEAKRLRLTLSTLQPLRKAGHELIVVDGGSRDNSVTIALSMADHVLVVKPGRARQMNAGANIASRDILLFLHADTQLPEQFVTLIQSLVSQRQAAANIWGRFNVRLSSHKIIFRVIETFINLRSRLTSIATGDQAIFIHANLFRDIHGYPEIAIMEDIAICKRLRQISLPLCLPQQVITSSRRWEEHGIIATVWLMWKLRWLYFIGVSPDTLVKMYP